MLKNVLTNAETGRLLKNLEGAIASKSSAELKNESTKGLIAASAGVGLEGKFDAEEFQIGFQNIKTAPQKDADVIIIGSREFVPHKFEKDSFDVESFDSMNAQNNDEVRLAAINVISANALTPEDGIIGLCSIANVAAGETGKRIIASAPMITYGASNKGGIAIGGTKVPLISSLDDNEVFASARLPYKPVLRSAGDYPTTSYLEVNAPESITYNGEKVTTCPVLVGEKVDLKLLCSSTQYLTENGLALNPTLTLSEDGGIAAVLLRFKDSSDLENLVKIDISGERGTRFQSLNSGHGKDIGLTYTAKNRIKVAELTSSGAIVWTSTAGGKVFTNDNVEFVLEYTLNANANTDALSFSTTVSNIKLLEVYDNGVLVNSGSVYDSVKEIIALSKVSSITPRLFLSNTNNIDNGLLIDMDDIQFEIPAVCRTPITIRKTVLGETKAEVVAGIINAAKITNNAVKATEVLNTIDEYIAGNAAKADPDTGLIADVQMEGVGANYVKPAILSKEISPVSKANMRSAEAKEDISKYILDKIIAYANDLYPATNFDKAMSTIAQGETATLTIAAGTHIASYLKYAIAKGGVEGLDYNVEINKSSRLTRRVLATFKIGNEVYEFSPVILAQAPDFFYKGVETSNNGVNAVTKLIPRRNIIVNSGIFMDFQINDIPSAFDK